MFWNKSKKEGDVQSTLYGNINLKAEGGILVGFCIKLGVA